MARTKAEAIRNAGGDTKPRKVRWRPGTQAKREIRKYQSGKLASVSLIPKLSMERLVREIAQDFGSDIRFKPDAIGALQSAAESYLTDVFTRANQLRTYSNRETLEPRDLKMVQVLSQPSGTVPS